MSRKRTLQLASVVASLAILLWLLERIGWPAIRAALSHVSWTSAALLVLLAVGEGALDGVALRIIAGPSLSTGFAVAVNSAGSMLNLVLPWESGEVLKGSLMHGSLGTAQAISSTIIWNYLFKISRPALSLTAALVAVLLCRRTTRDAVLALVVAANVFAFLPYLVLRFAIRLGSTEKLVKLARRLPVLRRSPDRWVEVARDIDRQVRGFGHDRPAAIVEVFLLQLVARATGWMNVAVGFHAVGLTYGFGEATLVFATMNVAEYVIALLPARVGVNESTAFVVFRLYGLDAGMGLVLYTLLRVRTIVVHGILAPFAFVRRAPRVTAPPAPHPETPPPPRAERRAAGS